MKNFKTIALLAALIAALPLAFTACVKDDCSRMRSYTYYRPVYKTKEEVRANIRSNAPREIGKTGKLYIRGNYIFLNEVDKGIHVIDNSNPLNPRNVAFIDIPGNMELAVKGNMLYADLYTDLVAIDISNPSNVVVKKVIENLFPYRYYGYGFSADNSMIIAEWQRVDTTVREDCDTPSWITQDFMRDAFFPMASIASGAASSPYGIGGSMARFAILNDRMYTVTTSDLDVFNITNAADPVHSNTVNLGWDIETIYPFRNKLFIGSMTGMQIYNVSNPDNPTPGGSFVHARTCDPVIADDQYAYVTLSSGTPCAGFTNELNIVALNNLTDPQLLKVYEMNNPKGLSKDGDNLFICDGSAGLKVYNAANVLNLQHIRTIDGIDPFDVIAYNNIALVVAADGLYQYDYSDINNIRLLSRIIVNK